jgi:hypothetical protein
VPRARSSRRRRRRRGDGRRRIHFRWCSSRFALRVLGRFTSMKRKAAERRDDADEIGAPSPSPVCWASGAVRTRGTISTVCFQHEHAGGRERDSNAPARSRARAAPFAASKRCTRLPSMDRVDETVIGATLTCAPERPLLDVLSQSWVQKKARVTASREAFVAIRSPRPSSKAFDVRRRHVAVDALESLQCGIHVSPLRRASWR